LLRLIGYLLLSPELCKPGIVRLGGTVQILFANVTLQLKTLTIRLTDQTDNACTAERPALTRSETFQLLHGDMTAPLQSSRTNVNVPSHFE
jgi:hypothetical protein